MKKTKQRNSLLILSSSEDGFEEITLEGQVNVYEKTTNKNTTSI